MKKRPIFSHFRSIFTIFSCFFELLPHFNKQFVPPSAGFFDFICTTPNYIIGHFLWLFTTKKIPIFSHFRPIFNVFSCFFELFPHSDKLFVLQSAKYFDFMHITPYYEIGHFFGFLILKKDQFLAILN